MSEMLPFHGLLPQEKKAPQVSAVPYDVVNTEEAAKLAAGNPLSFLRVSRPEIELPAGTDIHSEEVYDAASENFARLCAEAPLSLDKHSHLYVYTLKMGEHIQTGLAGAVSVEDYKKDIIKKHEKTRQDKEDDRTRHLLATHSHTGPVFLTYKDLAEIDALISEISAGKPLFDFVAPDGISHRLWRASVPKSSSLAGLFRDKVPCMYIADGHHRAAAAVRAAAECRKANHRHTGKEDYNYFLAVAFPASQLRIMPYNRVVKDLNGLSPDALFAAIEKNFTLSKAESPSPAKPGEICMYINGKWQKLSPKFDTASLDVISRLDVSILQDKVLSPILGIDDPRTSKRIDFVGGIRGTGELERLVNGGKAALAFSMYPTSVAQLMDIADAGAIMPPKSTWFEPKLRDGLVCHNF